MSGEYIDAIDLRRRRFLVASTTVIGAAGAAVGSWLFIASMRPSERALAAGAPVVVDIAKLEPGQQITVAWQRKPVWVLYRTGAMLESLDGTSDRLRDPQSRVTSQQPDYAQNPYRSLRPEYLVTVAICTHLGCVPKFRPDLAPADLGPNWPGGYFCPCHGSRFDFAGRVYAGVPAPTNLMIPPYRFLSDSQIHIGVHSETVRG
jgi:ubiquinol-cytochrome c reductase iron-sulfur subunit